MNLSIKYIFGVVITGVFLLIGTMYPTEGSKKAHKKDYELDSLLKIANDNLKKEDTIDNQICIISENTERILIENQKEINTIINSTVCRSSHYQHLIVRE